MATCAEVRPIDAVIPYLLNNKTHKEDAIDRIASSIREFGWTYPLLIDENNSLLAGHKRLAAARKLGLAEVPVLVKSGLSEAQKKAYRIIDNKSSEESEWNLDNLKLDLDDLAAAEFDIEQFVLNDFDFGKDDEEVVEDDHVSAPATASLIKLGDVIQLGPHRLVCGDSTDPKVVAQLFEGGGAPVLMVTDPPYGVEYDPTWREKAGVSKNKAKMGKVQNDHRVDWSESYKLFNAQVAYVWHSGRYTKEFALSLEDAGFEIISQIIWNKERFALSRGDYHWKHEPCWYAVKAGKNHNWQGARDQSTVWDINAREDSGHGHGTQKPLECMARPIRNNSKAGDLICDPFLGSGTSLIAADQLGRVCYGTELEPNYCQIIINRYQAQCQKDEKEFECTINGEPYGA